MSLRINRIIALLLFVLLLFAGFNGRSAQAQTNYDLFDPLVDVCELIHRYYVTETDDEELISAAINGMLHQLDPYSEYVPPSAVSEFQMRTSGVYEGIGVGIDIQNGQLVVISPFEDSPAYRAGIRAGDIILEVQGQSTKDWSSTQAMQEMTGPAGSEVTLTIRHPDGTEHELVITRGQIQVPTVRGWRRNSIDAQWDYMLDPDAGIGYLRLTQFNEDSLDFFDRAVLQMKDQNMQAMILDLRSNPGGLMSTAVAIIDRLIDHGVIVSTRGAHSPEQVQNAQAEGTYWRFHLVVLIDQGSASASEIVAGSLQDHGRAVIVGQRSWGKGSVQRVIHLPDSGAALKLTTDYYYLPNGRCVHRLPHAEMWGVEPDIEEALERENAEDLRLLMDQLIVEPLTEIERRAVETADNPPSVEELSAADNTRRTEQYEQLMQLDNQLDQAVKQCRGLLRAHPTLSGLAESLTE
ncbi:MAG: S41 family peptidase [Sedimentisphaerales bacterium]|nr:S41 family peptidase [Sedimentisphaerales bacterium]